MKVILRQDVSGLGKRGTAVEVSDGYARNFLIPRGVAVAASAANLRSLEEEAVQAKKRHEKELATAQAAAAQADGAYLRFPVKCGESGRVFGAVTSKDIAAALGRKLGTEVDKRRVELAEPLKVLGIRDIMVRFNGAASARIQVELVEE